MSLNTISINLTKWPHKKQGDYKKPNQILRALNKLPFWCKNAPHRCLLFTVNTVLMTAALIQFDENLAPDLLSKNYVLLRLLIKCGSYKSAATNTVFTVFLFLLNPKYCSIKKWKVLIILKTVFREKSFVSTIQRAFFSYKKGQIMRVGE